MPIPRSSSPTGTSPGVTLLETLLALVVLTLIASLSVTALQRTSGAATKTAALTSIASALDRSRGFARDYDEHVVLTFHGRSIRAALTGGAAEQPARTELPRGARIATHGGPAGSGTPGIVIHPTGVSRDFTLRLDLDRAKPIYISVLGLSGQIAVHEHPPSGGLAP